MKHFNFKSRVLPCTAFAAAIALVVSFSSFTGAADAKVEQTLVTFSYDAPNSGADYSSSSVANLSNWKASTETCDNEQERACSIQVHEAYVNNPTSSNPTLKDDFVITPSESEDNNYYVESISDPTGQIINQSIQ